MSTQHHQPAIWQRVTGWGEALTLEIGHGPGLSPLVRVCNDAAGDQGVRNTYAKLYTYETPPTTDDPKDYFRAWLILTALGQDPAAWGIDDDAVPPGYEINRLRDLVLVASGWLHQTAALAS